MTDDKDDYSDSVALDGIASAIKKLAVSHEFSIDILATQIGRVADAILELAEAARER